MSKKLKRHICNIIKYVIIHPFETEKANLDRARWELTHLPVDWNGVRLPKEGQPLAE